MNIKKILKPIWIILIGILLVLIGYMLGGRMKYFMYKIPAKDSRLDRMYKNILGREIYEEIFEQREDEYMKERSNNFFEGKTETLNDITDVSVSLKYATLEIDLTSDFDYAQYSVENIKPENFICKIENGKLIIEDKTPKKNILNIFFEINKRKNIPRIMLKMPQNFVCKNLNLHAGVSEIKLNGITADNFVFESGVGDARFENIRIKASCKFNAGVGETKIIDSEINNLILKAGVGEVYFSGKLSGNTILSGGIGETTFSLEGSESDYNFDLSTGLGKIKINGQSSSSFLGSHKSENNGAANNIKITSGIGEVKIKFKK